jgi:hypothetical protein
MKSKVIKYIGGILVIIIFLPIVYTTAYYLVEIRPHSESISEKIKNYSSKSNNLALLENMVVKEEGRNGIARYISHSLAIEHTDGYFRNLWHLIGLHWHLWVGVIYSEQEQYALWLALAHYGKGQGINGASVYYFNKPIEQLTCYQLAQLVVMVRAPTIFKPGSKRSDKRIKERGIANVCGS